MVCQSMSRIRAGILVVYTSSARAAFVVCNAITTVYYIYLLRYQYTLSSAKHISRCNFNDCGNFKRNPSNATN